MRRYHYSHLTEVQSEVREEVACPRSHGTKDLKNSLKFQVPGFFLTSPLFPRLPSNLASSPVRKIKLGKGLRHLPGSVVHSRTWARKPRTRESFDSLHATVLFAYNLRLKGKDSRLWNSTTPRTRCRPCLSDGERPGAVLWQKPSAL